MGATVGETTKIVYWHRELPPPDAEPLEEHHVEATSDRISGTIAHREELWDECRAQLARHAEVRLKQEVARLGGRYAHVLNELVEVKRDSRTNQAWLYGLYTYMLFR
jgi:hypothetical protein